jgi:hypothetical protein
MLLFQLSGLLLFRLAERTLLSLLFHDPPRSTRPRRPLSIKRIVTEKLSFFKKLSFLGLTQAA